MELRVLHMSVHCRAGKHLKIDFDTDLASNITRHSCTISAGVALVGTVPVGILPVGTVPCTLDNRRDELEQRAVVQTCGPTSRPRALPSPSLQRLDFTLSVIVLLVSPLLAYRSVTVSPIATASCFTKHLRTHLFQFMVTTSVDRRFSFVTA